MGGDETKKKIFQIVRFFFCLINQLIYFSLLSFVIFSVLKLNFHTSLEDLGNHFVNYLLQFSTYLDGFTNHYIQRKITKPFLN